VHRRLSRRRSFFVLSDDEKIAGPSFERHQAAASVLARPRRLRPAEIVRRRARLPERWSSTTSTRSRPPLPDPYRLDPERLRVVLQVGALQAAASRTNRPGALPRCSRRAAGRRPWLRAPRCGRPVPLTDELVPWARSSSARATTWSQAVAQPRRPAPASRARAVVPVFDLDPA
jgi:hypothetical protein